MAIPAAADGAQPDDLKRIEGIGPKIDAALKAVGLISFAQLEHTPVDTLRGILEKAELPAQASVVTWGEQAGFLVRGDEAGFKALTDRLTAGRNESKAEASSAPEAPASAPAAETPAAPEKPRSPKIKRWEPNK